MLTSLWSARRALGLLAVLSFTPVACSDEPRRGGSDEPEPDGTEPAGAVKMEVYATEEQTCPPKDLQLAIGNVSSSPPVKVFDGFEGASVACAVVPKGDAFQASGTITDGSFTFSFRDLLTGGSSAVGNVEIIDPKTGVTFASSSATPCVFQFAPNSEQSVAAGRIFVQFDCSKLVSAASAMETCSSRYGYVLVENCATTAP